MQLNIGYITNVSSLDVMRSELAMSRLVGIDTETTGLDPHTDRIRLLQIASGSKVYVLDLFKLPLAAVRPILDDLLNDRRVVKVFHNAKFDLEMIATTFGIPVTSHTQIFDTMLAMKLIKGGQLYSASLDNVCRDMLGLELDKTYQRWDYSRDIYREQITYAGVDAGVLLPLYPLMTSSLRANSLTVPAQLEFDCIPATAQLELDGIRLDKTVWLEATEHDKSALYEVERQLWSELGEISLSSPAQVCRALSARLGVPVTSKAAPVLREMLASYVVREDMFGQPIDHRPLIELLLRHAKLVKRLDAYGPGFLKHIHPKTGRVHSNYQQMDTKTARFSSNRPNLQNIPRDSALRQAFVPDPGNRFCVLDYSQIELRILAQLSGDEPFMQAFHSGTDLHSAMAALMTGRSVESVTPEERHFAKTINFGVPYGMGSSKLAATLRVDQVRAKNLLKEYYSSHPRIAEWFRRQEEYFRTHDCVRSCSGRVRALPDWRLDEQQEFIAVQASKNFPIQSTNADIIKGALARLVRELPASARIVNQVHDELLVECPADDAEHVLEVQRRVMIEVARQYLPDVPVKVEGGIFECWKK